MLKHLGVASFVVFGIVINSQWGEGSGFGSLFSFSWDSGTGDLLDNGELLEDSFPEDFVWGVATSAYQVIKLTFTSPDEKNNFENYEFTALFAIFHRCVEKMGEIAKKNTQ